MLRYLLFCLYVLLSVAVPQNPNLNGTDNNDPVQVHYAYNKDGEHSCHCKVLDGSIIHVAIRYASCNPKQRPPGIPTIGDGTNIHEIGQYVPGRSAYSSVCSKIEAIPGPTVIKVDEITLKCSWHNEWNTLTHFGCLCVSFPYGNYEINPTIVCNLELQPTPTPTALEILSTSHISTSIQKENVTNLIESTLSPYENPNSENPFITEINTEMTTEAAPIFIETYTESNSVVTTPEVMSAVISSFTTDRTIIEITSDNYINVQNVTEISNYVTTTAILNDEQPVTKPQSKPEILSSVRNETTKILASFVEYVIKSVKQVIEEEKNVNIIVPTTVSFVTEINDFKNEPESDVNILNQNVQITNQNPINVGMYSNLTTNVTIIVKILQNLQTEYNDLKILLVNGFVPFFILIISMVSVVLLFAALFAVCIPCVIRYFNYEVANIMTLRGQTGFESVSRVPSQYSIVEDEVYNAA